MNTVAVSSANSSMASSTCACATCGPWNWIAVCSVPPNCAVQSQILSATSDAVPTAKLSFSAMSSNEALSGPPRQSVRR